MNKFQKSAKELIDEVLSTFSVEKLHSATLESLLENDSIPEEMKVEIKKELKIRNSKLYETLNE